jgi:hypothetical protein
MAREVLLGAIGEDEFARQIQRWARRAGWCGYHVRYSQAVVQGLHTLRLDGHSDAHGMPDWLFCHQEAGHPLVLAELKRATSAARITRDQRRWLDLLNQADGVRTAVWRPDMETEIKSALGV